MSLDIFNNPEYFWLLLSLPLAIAWYVFKNKKQTTELGVSSVKGFKFSNSKLYLVKHVLFGLKCFALSLAILAMARPRSVDVSTKSSSTKGIDIVISIDVSASMLARDLEPNRLEALKNVAADFIKGRPTDRIG